MGKSYEVTEEILEEYMFEYDARNKIREKFIADKEYIGIIESLSGVNNQSEYWNEKIGYTFDFLYGYGGNLHCNSEDEVAVRYKNKVLVLFEMHGQGCYQSITVHDKYSDEILIEDIVSYYDTNIKPVKYKALELIDTSFKTLMVAQGIGEGNSIIKLNGEEFDLREIKEYLFKIVMN